MNEKIEQFFEQDGQWKAELLLLRSLILQHPELKEDYKWMHPCYTINNKNVIVIHGFKEYCALLFFKGALLKDEKNILIQQTENVQAARQIRFTNFSQIEKLQKEIHSYIKQAIEIEQSGQKVILKKVNEYPIPEEFKNYLNTDFQLKTAFYMLTPGRQKAYLYFFNQAKQSTTKISRIEKYYPKILSGKGLND